MRYQSQSRTDSPSRLVTDHHGIRQHKIRYATLHDTQGHQSTTRLFGGMVGIPLPWQGHNHDHTGKARGALTVLHMEGLNRLLCSASSLGTDGYPCSKGKYRLGSQGKPTSTPDGHPIQYIWKHASL